MSGKIFFVFVDSNGREYKPTIESILEGGTPIDSETGDDLSLNRVESKELSALLNRAAAALETPGDLSATDKQDVINDLTIAAAELSGD